MWSVHFFKWMANWCGAAAFVFDMSETPRVTHNLELKKNLLQLSSLRKTLLDSRRGGCHGNVSIVTSILCFPWEFSNMHMHFSVNIKNRGARPEIISRKSEDLLIFFNFLNYFLNENNVGLQLLPHFTPSNTSTTTKQIIHAKKKQPTKQTITLTLIIYTYIPFL